MLLRDLFLACAFASPSGVASAPATTTSTSPAGLDVVIVRAPETSAEALGDALRVRLPDARVLPFADESFARVQGRPFVYLEVTVDEGPDPTTHLLFVLSDGRAYLRDVRPEPEQPARSVAATIAVTLGAIEEERLLPDRTQVPVPRPEPTPDPPAPASERNAAPAAPPTPASPTIHVDRDAAPPRQPAVPRAHVGVGATVVGLFGLAPGTPAAAFPVGAAVDAAVRWPIGLVVDAGVRGLTRAREGYRLLRVRGHVGAGFVWMRRRLELGATIGPTVEGWTIRDADGRVASRGPVGSRRPPLLGAAATVTAGVLVPSGPKSGVRVRIAARAELGASALPSGSAARIVDVGPPPSTIFAAGGMEATLGLDVRVWLPRATQR